MRSILGNRYLPSPDGEREVGRSGGHGEIVVVGLDGA